MGILNTSFKITALGHNLKYLYSQFILHSPVLASTASNRFQNSFSHIFAGGYAAGYYSYKWAEVLASDAFDRFEQEGIFNTETGKQFRQAVLAVGGKDSALTAFVNFRGREPKIDALLRHQGWTNNTKNA